MYQKNSLFIDLFKSFKLKVMKPKVHTCEVELNQKTGLRVQGF